MSDSIPVRDVIKLMDQLIAMMMILKADLQRLESKLRKDAD